MDRISIGGTPSDGEPDNVVPLHGPAAEEGDGPEVSYEEALAADRDEPADDDGSTGPSAPGSGVAVLIEQGLRVGAGLFSTGATAFADALRASMPDTDDTDDTAATLAGAGLGAAVTATEAAASAATKAAEAMAPLVSWALEPRFVKEAGEAAAGATRLLDGRWKAAQAETADAASSFLAMVVPEILRSIMDQVDLTALVREHLDVNEIVDDVDLDKIIGRVDVDAVLARVDMDRLVADLPIDDIVERVDVNRVVGKVDVDEIVDSVDVERVIERVDVTSIVDRLDLTAIAQEVIDDVDLPALVRDSTGVVASEYVQTVRVRSMNADRLVARVVDKVLHRRARDLAERSDG